MHEEWGRRFEHGFSQLVDWLWVVDAYRHNPDFESRFGKAPVTFFGVLVIGRRHFLTEIERQRLRWRLERVVVDSKRMTCHTFDDLGELIEQQLEMIVSLAHREYPET